MMGYAGMAEDVLKAAQEEKAKQAAAAGQSPAPQSPAPQSPAPQAPAPQAPAPQAPAPQAPAPQAPAPVGPGGVAATMFAPPGGVATGAPGGAPPAGAPGVAKTVMQDPGAPMPVPGPGSGPAPVAPAPVAARPAGPAPGSGPMPGPPGGAPMGQPPHQGAPPMGQPPMGQPPMGAPPMGAPPYQGGPGAPPYQGGPGAPPMGAPPYQGGPGAPPYQGGPGAPPMGQPPMGAPPYGGPPAPNMPPYLASQTGTRMNQPVEPWADSLRGLCSKFGILLCIALVLPVAFFDGKMAFLYELLSQKQAPLGVRLIPILIMVTGIGAIVIARSGVTTTMRGWIATGLGFTPLLLIAIYMQDATAGNRELQMVLAGAGESWRIIFSFLGLLVLATGLLVRSNYPAAILGRAITTSGAVAVLLVALVPINDHIPLIAIFKTLGADIPTQYKLFALWGLVPFVLASLGLLLTWLPASTSSGTTTVAWGALLFYPTSILVMIVALLAIEGGDPEAIFRVPLVWYHIPITLLAWFALGAYGTATVVGKQLEHS